MKVLFIGNSYTFYNDMPKMFQALAAENGKSVAVYSVTKGGRRLIGYADNTDPVTVRLDELLAEQRFDICFIQEQSLLPALDYDAFVEGLDRVVNKVKDRAGRMVLYATWGRKSGNPELLSRNWTTEKMTDMLTAAYQNAAELYGAEVSPAGESFLYITKNYPNIDLYDEDGSHPSYIGSCLIALTHYYTVFGDYPKHMDSLSLDDLTLSAFKGIICNKKDKRI